MGLQLTGRARKLAAIAFFGFYGPREQRRAVDGGQNYPARVMVAREAPPMARRVTLIVTSSIRLWIYAESGKMSPRACIRCRHLACIANSRLGLDQSCQLEMDANTWVT